jgi:hypothetical protein
MGLCGISASAAMLVALATTGCASRSTQAEVIRTLRQMSLTSQDFSFVRARYAGSYEERREWEKLLEWARGRSRRGADAATRLITRQALPAPITTPASCFGDEACDWVLRTEAAASSIPTWTEFAAAWEQAKPAVHGALRLAQAERQDASQGVDQELKARLRTDQSLRAALQATQPRLGDAGRALYRLAIGMAVTRADHDNTRWLKALIAKQGWPRPPSVSRQAEEAAWVMTLHARHDPAFRIAALQAMLAAGASPAAHAVRLDHVFSETFGLQRYGTKGECSNGRFVPVPTEDQEGLEERRRAVGLPSSAEQIRIMEPACEAFP